MKTLADVIIEDMERRPLDYNVNDGYTLENRRASFSVWVANGFWFYGIRRGLSIQGGFSLLDKLKFHFAFSKWKAVAGIAILEARRFDEDKLKIVSRIQKHN